jgi:hypothetical protein
VGSAARRLAAHAGYLELMAVAEFARRREAQLEASKARGDRVRSRDGEYPAEELGFEMTATAYSAGLLIDLARNIAGRLPRTLAGMAAGLIDRDRARVISNATLHLPDDKAAVADQVLAQAAAELRLADLQQKAARLQARLDPEGVRARKEDRKRDRRVEVRREDSGAASGTSSRPPPAIPAPAGATPSPGQPARPSRTPAPAAPTPGPSPRPAATAPPGRAARQAPGRAARRAPGRAERRPRAHRQGNLRPRPPRGPLHPQQEAETPDPRPHGPLLRTRLRRPGDHVRDRPHRALPRRGNV